MSRTSGTTEQPDRTGPAAHDELGEGPQEHHVHEGSERPHPADVMLSEGVADGHQRQAQRGPDDQRPSRASTPRTPRTRPRAGARGRAPRSTAARARSTKPAGTAPRIGRVIATYGPAGPSKVPVFGIRLENPLRSRHSGLPRMLPLKRTPSEVPSLVSPPEALVARRNRLPRPAPNSLLPQRLRPAHQHDDERRDRHPRTQRRRATRAMARASGGTPRQRGRRPSRPPST